MSENTVHEHEEHQPSGPGSERGAGLVEYALLVALIAIVCLSAVTAFGSNNEGSINNTSDSVASAIQSN